VGLLEGGTEVEEGEWIMDGKKRRKNNA